MAVAVVAVVAMAVVVAMVVVVILFIVFVEAASVVVMGRLSLLALPSSWQWR